MKQRRQTGSGTRAVAYVRVSTDRQAESGVSLDAQQHKIRLYAELHEITLVETVVEAGVSGKSLARPELQKALDLLTSGAAEALIVAKLDRLTRSVRDLGELVERFFIGGQRALLSVSEQIDTRTAAGRLVLNVLGAVSQWEREAIAERTSVALRFKAARGEYIGGDPPFGFALAEDQVTLRADAAELATVRLARELRAKQMSLRAIARALAAEGCCARSGRPFMPSQLKRLLEREYA